MGEFIWDSEEPGILTRRTGTVWDVSGEASGEVSRKASGSTAYGLSWILFGATIGILIAVKYTELCKLLLSLELELLPSSC